MSIPEGKLYGDVDIAAGKIAEHHPSTYITTRVAAGAIIFGQALAKFAGKTVRFAELEGLPAHGRSVSIRQKPEKS